VRAGSPCEGRGPRPSCITGKKRCDQTGRSHVPSGTWRRGWDSNPRASFPATRFPSVLLKPLGHLSARSAGPELPADLREGAGEPSIASRPWLTKNQAEPRTVRYVAEPHTIVRVAEQITTRSGRGFHLNLRRNLSSRPKIPFWSRTPTTEMFSLSAHSNWMMRCCEVAVLVM
jgi:hypothetical protein